MPVPADRGLRPHAWHDDLPKGSIKGSSNFKSKSPGEGGGSLVDAYRLSNPSADTPPE